MIEREIPTSVILVDDLDRDLGAMEKMEAHRKGLLHRAFSVFLVDPEGRLILQRRATGKYHSPGLWTNTCCSHPVPGESVEQAAKRRLREEMGIDCPMTKVFSFVYRHEFSNGIIEHEFDHVLIGTSNNVPVINQSEVAEWRAVLPDTIRSELRQNPEGYTIWFRLCFEETVSRMKMLAAERSA